MVNVETMMALSKTAVTLVVETTPVALAAGVLVDTEGGAVSAYEMERRRAALDDLDRAARRALVGASTSRTG